MVVSSEQRFSLEEWQGTASPPVCIAGYRSDLRVLGSAITILSTHDSLFGTRYLAGHVCISGSLPETRSRGIAANWTWLLEDQGILGADCACLHDQVATPSTVSTCKRVCTSVAA